MKTNNIFEIRGFSFTNIENKKIYCHCPLPLTKMGVAWAWSGLNSKRA
jgi:hypothetical protein